MDKGIETFFNMPHNQLRKASYIGECIRRLEELQRRYRPIFDEDPKINQWLEEMRSEYEVVMEMLRTREDASSLLDAYFKER